MSLLGAALRTLQFLSPDQAARVAEFLFFKPPRSRLGAVQRQTLQQARGLTMNVSGRRVAVWQWGDAGRPVVYLVHGWGSRGGRLAAFVEPLAAAGYRVVAFD